MLIYSIYDPLLLKNVFKAFNPLQSHLTGIVWIILCTFTISSCTSDNPEEKEAQADPSTAESFSDRLTEVDTSILRTGTFYREVISQGKVGSSRKIDVPFTAQGLIIDVPVRDGQHVEKGDVLVALDDFVIRNEMKKLEAQLNQNKLNIENHYINLGYQPNQLADIPEEVKRNAAIQFNMESLLIDQERLNHELANSQIKAPFAGTIADLKVNAGAHTSAYDKVCTLVDNRHLSIEFPVLESEMQRVQNGMSIQIEPFFQSVEKLPGTGRITNISPVVNQQGMIVCRAQIGKGNIPYRDGMRVNVFIRDAIQDVLVLPKAAVVDRQNRLVVFTLSPDNRAEWNYVELGGENSDSYLIREGVEAGDTIIMNNNFDLAHLEKVKVSN